MHGKRNKDVLQEQKMNSAKMDSFHRCHLLILTVQLEKCKLPWPSKSEWKHLLNKAGTLSPTNTVIWSMEPSDRTEKPWLKAPQSMKHEESLRYKRRTVCYSGKHTVIQRPCTLGGKCLEGKSVFVNDMGQLFWGRLDLYAHLEASLVPLGGGFVFHCVLPLLRRSHSQLVLWVIQSSAWWKCVYTLFCMSNSWHCMKRMSFNCSELLQVFCDVCPTASTLRRNAYWILITCTVMW